MTRRRMISFVLAVVMLLSTAVIPINAESEIQYTEADLHEMITYADAVAAGHVNRLNDEEDMNTLIFANRDNTKTMYYYGENIKYTDENGTVRDKTNKLTYSNGVYVNEDNDINVAIPTSLSSGVTLTYEDIEITMIPEFVGAGSLTSTAPTATLTSTSRGQADNVTYDSVFGSGISVRYTPMYSGIKEDIILSSYTGTYSFDFTIDTNGLLMLPDTALAEAEEETELDDSLNADDNATLVTPPNWYFATREDPTTPVAWLSEIYIYDSVGNTALGSVSVEQTAASEYSVTVIADKAFLEAESTVYPVTVDPSIEFDHDDSDKYQDATIIGQYPTTNYGSSTSLSLNGANDSYFAIKFQGLEQDSAFTGLVSGQIKNATLKLRCSSVNIHSSDSDQKVSVYIHQYNPTQYNYGVYWEESTITYSRNGVAYNSGSQHPQAVQNLTATGEVSFNITNHVKEWADSSTKTFQGILCHLASTDYTNGYNSVSFFSGEYAGAPYYRPYLKVDYVCDGIYQIRNKATNNMLNVAYSSASNGADVYQYEEDYTAGQAFRVVYNATTDTYRLYSICSNYGYSYVIRQQSGDADDISSGAYTAATGEWELIYSSGYYKIKLHNANYYISVSGSGNESDIYLNTTSTTDNEKWTFELIDADGCASVSGMTHDPQEYNNTCSSACAEMVLAYYGIDVDETTIYNYQDNNCGEDDFTFTWVLRDAINYYLPDSIGVEYEYNTKSNPISNSGQYYYQILKSLLNGNPVIVMICLNNGKYVYNYSSSSHYVVISGITYVNGEYQLTIYDPWVDSKWFPWEGDTVLTCPADDLFDCLVSRQFLFSEN